MVRLPRIIFEECGFNIDIIGMPKSQIFVLAVNERTDGL